MQVCSGYVELAEVKVCRKRKEWQTGDRTGSGRALPSRYVEKSSTPTRLDDLITSIASTTPGGFLSEFHPLFSPPLYLALSSLWIAARSNIENEIEHHLESCYEIYRVYSNPGVQYICYPFRHDAESRGAGTLQKLR